MNAVGAFLLAAVMAACGFAALPAATLCANEMRPAWDSRMEDRAALLREATYRLVWHVCYPGGLEGVRVAADLRAGDLEVRDGLLAQLRDFIESFVLLQGDDGAIPAKG